MRYHLFLVLLFIRNTAQQQTFNTGQETIDQSENINVTAINQPMISRSANTITRAGRPNFQVVTLTVNTNKNPANTTFETSDETSDEKVSKSSGKETNSIPPLNTVESAQPRTSKPSPQDLSTKDLESNIIEKAEQTIPKTEATTSMKTATEQTSTISEGTTTTSEIQPINSNTTEAPGAQRESKMIECEPKSLGQRDNNWNLPGCASGPGWIGGQPSTVFMSHDFHLSKDTYTLNWAPLVKRKDCVTKIQININNQWQDTTSKDPLPFEVPTPDCSHGNFNLKLKLFFRGLPSINPLHLGHRDDKCLEVNLDSITAQIPEPSDIINTNTHLNKEENEDYLNIFWRKNMFKSENCFDRVEVTTVVDNEFKKIFKSSRGPNKQYVTIQQKCHAITLNFTYFFKANIEPYSNIVNVPGLSSQCQHPNNTSRQDESPDSMNKIPTLSPDSKTSKGFLVKHRLPIIIIGSCFSGVALIAIVVLVIVIVRRRRKRREENNVPREDLNPAYGVYYSGEADYSTVTDNNALYEREGGEDGHNIVRDNNSNYGNTG